jgi:ATP-dependent DNA helicase PIF1
MNTLNEQQQKAFNMAIEGKSICITAEAGYGKTYLLNQIINRLSSNGLFITAATGFAAINIGGTTVHSFAGIGLGADSADKLLLDMKRQAKLRWHDVTTLIIDEISMISAELFEKLDYIARKMKNNEAPFGGIQLIVSGDFLQLPPIKSSFCFESPYWNECIPTTIKLLESCRQKDESLIEALSEIRMGIFTDQTKALFNTCVDREFPDDGILPTKLYSTRASVDAENQSRLEKLTTEKIVYNAILEGDPYLAENVLAKNCSAPRIITLAVGAQVMLVKNLDFDMGLVNGSRGVVVSFSTENKQKQPIPKVKFTNGRVIEIEVAMWEINKHQKKKKFEYASYTQIPLMLAYASTIHKVQGATISRAHVDLSNMFEYAQTYVALSRIRDIESLHISTELSAKMIRAHPKAISFYEQL